MPSFDPRQAIAPLREMLASMRRQIALRAAVEGTARGGAIAFVVLVLIAWTLGHVFMSDRLRTAGLVLVLFAVFVPAIYALASALRRFRDDYALAEWLEEHVPVFRTDIRAALDLAERPPAKNVETAGLRRALLERVRTMAERHQGRLADALPRADLRPWARMSAGVLLAACVLMLVSPERTKAGVSALIAGVPELIEESSAPVVEEALVMTVDVRYQPPAYTGLLPYAERNSTGDIETFEGTEVEVVIWTRRPVQGGRLLLELGGDDAALELTPIDSRALTTSFVATEAGSYRVELDFGDREAVDPVTRSIRVAPDEAPRIELLEPAGELEVVPEEIVNLLFVATDDFALGDVELVYYFEGEDNVERVVPLQNQLERASHEEHVPFELGPLMLQPRDEVVAFVRATDMSTSEDGPNVGVSRTVRMRVASPDDRHQEVLELKRALFEAGLSTLSTVVLAPLNDFVADEDAQELSPTPRGGPVPERAGFVAAAGDAHEAYAELFPVFEELLEQMNEDSLTMIGDLERLQALYDRLYELARNQGNRFARTERDVGQGTIDDGAYLELAAHDWELQGALERTIITLEDMVASHIADDVERTLEELEGIRERLRELLEEYRETNDPALREQIEAELRRLEARMQELMQRLASQIEELPYEHLNMEALEPSELSENVGEMTSALDQIRQMMEEGDIDAAIEALEQLEMSLDFLDQELGSESGGGSSDQMNEFDEMMGELMDEVNNLEMSEQDLETRTTELIEQMRQERQAEIGDEVNARLQEALEQVRALQQELAEAPKERASSETQSQMQQVEEGLERLEEALESEDIAGSYEYTSRMISRFNDTIYQVSRDLALSRRDTRANQELGELRQIANDGERTMSELRRELEELMQLSQSRPTPSQQQAMQELSEEQGEIQQRAEQLGERLDELGERFPEVPEELGPPLQQVGESMQQAQQDLREGRPRPANRGEQQALEGLRTMRQQMQQMTRQQRRREAQQRGPNSEEEVEIPGEQDNDRAGFRDDVMDAMREGSLESYQNPIQRYYESLVR